MKYLASISLVVLIIDRYLKGITAGTINSSSFLGIGGNDMMLVLHVGMLLILGYILWKGTAQISARTGPFLLGMGIVSLSNLLDRLQVGGVIDYIRLGSIQFNVADMWIDLLLLILLIDILFLRDKGEKNNS